jgi:hypothetical protein
MDGRFAKGHTNGFKPGICPNPGGRPRDTVTPHLREIAQERGRELAEMLFDEAIKNRNVQAANAILDRLEGKPKQALDVAINEPRALFESAVAALVEKHGVTAEEATAVMLDVMPEAKAWIN